MLDRLPPASAIAGTHDWDVARLHEPYGDGTYHGKLLKRVRKQLRSVSSREALVTPFLLRREWGRMTRRRKGRPYQPYPARTTNWAARLVIVAIGFIMVIGIAVLAFSR